MLRKVSKVIITVRDHGTGVPAAIAERIFDPFFLTKGTCKGLSILLSFLYNKVKYFDLNFSTLNYQDSGTLFTIELAAVRVAAK